MKFILREDIVKGHWIIVSEKGRIISGPKRFENKVSAENWARNFVSSWVGSNLIIE